MAETLSGAAIIDTVKKSGIEFVLSLPDITTSEGLLFPIAADRGLRLIRVCKEDEAIGISAGLSYGGKRALILIQHTGMLDSVNALRAVAVEYRLPILMMVGLLNREPGVPPTQSKSYGVRIVEPILDAMGIHHELLESNADIERIGPAIERCYGNPEPIALLIGRSPTAS